VNIFSRVAARIGRVLARYRGYPFFEGLESVVYAFHQSLNNVDFQADRNGEHRVLHKLQPYQFECLFDVGANVGEFSVRAASLFPNSTIHAFEIVPLTFETLVRNIDGLNNVIANPVGLSSDGNQVSINMGDEISTATAFKIEGMKYHDEYYHQSILCETIKASDYVRANSITKIDFLKIDVEGMDMQVIKGFEKEISLVRVIQFEYGIFNISSHDLLADFCRYLEGYGFVVGKIYPRCVQFFDYHFSMENFHGSNYLAVKKDEAELIKVLSAHD
jgi:FkbM family methyltransferase